MYVDKVAYSASETNLQGVDYFTKSKAGDVQGTLPL